MRKLRQALPEEGRQQGLQRQVSSSSRREKILAPPSFCQDAATLSVGISKWPRPGVARRRPADSASVRRCESLRYDS
ncbi:MAG: hypothetical protein FJX16_00930 [Alphaproteobacteria bacterium]|nr:hypothetical protein [Alphaproteobacteria bacterium]MBM3623890.1 hypothetical protein [Alphaproteobacteria bacterium]